MKKLFDVIGLPLLFAVSQFFLTITATIIFLLTSNQSNLETWIGTEDYINSLSQFFSKYSVIVVVVLFFIFFPIFYKKYHKKEETKKITVFDFLLLIILGISFSLLYNAILGSLNFIFPLTNSFSGTTNLVSTIISTVLLGPILEEYLFRGIVYQRLQKYYPVMKSLLLTGFIFAFSHTDLFGILYAFIFNFMLIFVYEKYHLKASILVHVSANMASLLFAMFIYQNFWLIELTLVISSLLLIGSYLGIKKETVS